MHELRCMRGEVSEEDYSLGHKANRVDKKAISLEKCEVSGMMRYDLRQRITEGIQLFYRDIKSARWAVMLVIAYFVFLKKVLHSLCPVVLITGFPCPGCGLTRAFFRALRLDFAGAWETHPFIFAVLILAVVFGAERYVCQSRGMKASKWLAIAVMTGMVVFYIWRMLYLFPDVPPMTYYYRNLLIEVLRR